MFYNATVIIHHRHEDGSLPNVATRGSHLDVTLAVCSRQPSAIVRDYSFPTGKPIFRCRLHTVTAVRILSDSMMINPKSIVQLMVFLYQMNEENVIIFRSYLRILLLRFRRKSLDLMPSSLQPTCEFLLIFRCVQDRAGASLKPRRVTFVFHVCEHCIMPAESRPLFPALLVGDTLVELHEILRWLYNGCGGYCTLLQLCHTRHRKL